MRFARLPTTVRRRWPSLALGLAISASVLSGSVATAQEDDPSADTVSSDDRALELARRHAPVMMVKAQDGPCDASGEPYGPTSVEIVLDNPGVVLRQLGPGDPVLQRAPSAADLFGLGEGFHLDFPGSALDPGCLYETDFNALRRDQPPTVYAHVARQPDRPDRLALQYWFYWYYNDWNNKHESDWEGIQLLFEASTVEEALASEPISVGYAQHEGGERADWTDEKLERDGDRPVVYSSAGSHASYFGSAVYLGRGPDTGFGCDTTDGPSDRVDPEVVVLPDTVTDPDDPFAWLAFTGRWGERQSGPFNGPTGPATKDRWTAPIDWHDDLRDTSVVIPGGDGVGASVIESFCGVVEAGSGVLLRFTRSPLQTGLALVLLVLAVRALVRRTSWARVALSPIVFRRRAGEILRATAARYRSEPLRFVRFGVVFVPISIVAGLLGAAIGVLPVVGDMLTVAGDQSGVNVVLTLLAGGLPSVLTVVAVNAVVTASLATPGAGAATTTRDALARAWERRVPLAAGLLRAVAVVVACCITIVGIPWGIRQLVRYQFLAQVVMAEPVADGRAGLSRSTELVRGRWWHTLAMLTAVDGSVAVASTTVGLVLLLLLGGLPIWVFSAVVTAVAVLLVPAGAIARVYLYGDARAEKDVVGSAA